MKIFNHVQIKVKDLKASRRFFDAIMEVLEYPVVLNTERVVGYGTSVHDMFEIRQYDEEAPLSQSVHIAFNALSKEVVELFYETAIRNGGACNGKPEFCPEYEEGYYAAFVFDLDGNNIEAVYSNRLD